MNARTQLRKLLGAARYLIAPGAYDTLTARLVQAPASMRFISPAAATRAPAVIPTSAC